MPPTRVPAEAAREGCPAPASLHRRRAADMPSGPRAAPATAGPTGRHEARPRGPGEAHRVHRDARAAPRARPAVLPARHLHRFGGMSLVTVAGDQDERRTVSARGRRDGGVRAAREDGQGRVGQPLPEPPRLRRPGNQPGRRGVRHWAQPRSACDRRCSCGRRVPRRSIGLDRPATMLVRAAAARGLAQALHRSVAGSDARRPGRATTRSPPTTSRAGVGPVHGEGPYVAELVDDDDQGACRRARLRRRTARRARPPCCGRGRDRGAGRERPARGGRTPPRATWSGRGDQVRGAARIEVPVAKRAAPRSPRGDAWQGRLRTWKR